MVVSREFYLLLIHLLVYSYLSVFLAENCTSAEMFIGINLYFLNFILIEFTLLYLFCFWLIFGIFSLSTFVWLSTGNYNEALSDAKASRKLNPSCMRAYTAGEVVILVNESVVLWSAYHLTKNIENFRWKETGAVPAENFVWKLWTTFWDSPFSPVGMWEIFGHFQFPIKGKQ